MHGSGRRPHGHAGAAPVPAGQGRAPAQPPAPPGRRLSFRSKSPLARAILESLRPLLPAGGAVSVQLDSWYASGRLRKYVHRRGWHAVCALKSDRKLQGQRLRPFATTLPHNRYPRGRVTAADGPTTTSYVRDAVGRLARVPFAVRASFPKRHPRARAWAYALSTDLARSVVETPRGYGGRGSCAVVSFQVKTPLGLADFRVRSSAAVGRYGVAVQLAGAHVEQRFVHERSAPGRRQGDLIRRHREGHAQAWLTAALREALAGGAIGPVLQRFGRQPA